MQFKQVSNSTATLAVWKHILQPARSQPEPTCLLMRNACGGTSACMSSTGQELRAGAMGLQIGKSPRQVQRMTSRHISRQHDVWQNACMLSLCIMKMHVVAHSSGPVNCDDGMMYLMSSHRSKSMQSTRSNMLMCTLP